MIDLIIHNGLLYHFYRGGAIRLNVSNKRRSSLRNELYTRAGSERLSYLRLTTIRRERLRTGGLLHLVILEGVVTLRARPEELDVLAILVVLLDRHRLGRRVTGLQRDFVTVTIEVVNDNRGVIGDNPVEGDFFTVLRVLDCEGVLGIAVALRLALLVRDFGATGGCDHQDSDPNRDRQPAGPTSSSHRSLHFTQGAIRPRL